MEASSVGAALDSAVPKLALDNDKANNASAITPLVRSVFIISRVSGEIMVTGQGLELNNVTR